MRICIPAETYAPEVNGAAKFAQRLAEGLAARGHDVHVVAPSASGMPSSTVENGVTVHRVKSHRWYLHPTWMICMPWETKPALAELLDRIRPDVVHTQAHFVIGRYAFSEARKRGIPVVATNHFMPDNVRPYVKAPTKVIDVATSAAWKDLRRKFQSADRITVPTQLAADLLTANGFDAPIRAVSCGIDLSRFGAEVGPSAWVPDAPTVVFVGRLSQEKRPADILEALARTDASANLHAVIVGDGDQRGPLRARAEALGISDRVILTGKISDRELMEVYHAASFFCMPSTAELQSIATLEALAAGLPVVLADAVALPHLCRSGVNGYLFEPRNIADLTAAFNELLYADEERLASMSRASKDIASWHDIEHTLDTFEEIYTEARAEHGTGEPGPATSAPAA